GLGDAHAQGGGEAHDGGIPGVQLLRGDQLHAGHGDGGEYGDGGAPQHALGNGGEDGGELGGHPRQQQERAGQAEDRPVDDLVGGDDAHVLGVGGGGQAPEEGGEHVGDAVGHDAPLEL